MCQVEINVMLCKNEQGIIRHLSAEIELIITPFFVFLVITKENKSWAALLKSALFLVSS